MARLHTVGSRFLLRRILRVHLSRLCRTYRAQIKDVLETMSQDKDADVSFFAKRALILAQQLKYA